MRTLNILLSAIFVALLWAPLIKTISSHEQANLMTENRKRHALPTLLPTESSISAFPKNFDAYYQDVFGFRERLIKSNQRLKMNMGMSISEQAIKGKEGWYFYAGDTVMNDYRGLIPFSQNELERFRQSLEERQAWLKSQGIDYLFVLAPNKHSIYSEYMSDKYPKIGKETRADQIVAYLTAHHSSVNFLDLRPYLLQAKKTERVYHKVDTHWNDLGAYVGYREIIGYLRRFFPELTATPRDAFIERHEVTRSGDLGLLMGRRDDIHEENIELVPKQKGCGEKAPYTVQSVANLSYKGSVVFATTCNSGKRTALFFRDSFTVLLQPLLAENFAKVIHINKPYNHADAMEVIARDKPDVVVEESVERDLVVGDERALYSAARDKSIFDSYGQRLAMPLDKPGAKLAYSGMEIRPSGRGLDLITDSQDSSLVIYTASRQRPMVHLSLTAPDRTFLRVKFKMYGPDGVLTDGVRDMEIEAGANDVYLDMRAFPVQGDILLVPGLQPGKYHIDALEVRG